MTWWGEPGPAGAPTDSGMMDADHTNPTRQRGECPYGTLAGASGWYSPESVGAPEGLGRWLTATAAHRQVFPRPSRANMGTKRQALRTATGLVGVESGDACPGLESRDKVPQPPFLTGCACGTRPSSNGDDDADDGAASAADDGDGRDCAGSGAWQRRQDVAANRGSRRPPYRPRSRS